jgi:hypothetical protein
MTKLSILIALSLALPGCRLATAPMSASSSDATTEPRAAAASRATLPAEEEEDWRPLLDRLDVFVAGPHLMVHGKLSERAPVPFNDGWTLQMLLDTDQDASTGVFAGGYDYVVRGPERQPDGSLIVRITTGGGGPGGWGAEVGTAHFVENASTFHIRVPLRVIQDDGALNWAFYTFYDGALSQRVLGSCSPRRVLL